MSLFVLSKVTSPLILKRNIASATSSVYTVSTVCPSWRQSRPIFHEGRSVFLYPSLPDEAMWPMFRLSTPSQCLAVVATNGGQSEWLRQQPGNITILDTIIKGSEFAFKSFLLIRAEMKGCIIQHWFGNQDWNAWSGRHLFLLALTTMPMKLSF